MTKPISGVTLLGASIGYDRLKIILDEIKAGEGPGWKIGPIEITTVMYAASMDARTLGFLDRYG